MSDLQNKVMLNLEMMDKCPLCKQKPNITVERKKFSATHGCVAGVLVTTRQHAVWKRDEVAADWNAWCQLVREVRGQKG